MQVARTPSSGCEPTILTPDRDRSTRRPAPPLDINGPEDFLHYDGIIFGTPTWFSNVAYPVKALFDEHLIRIYEHREGRMDDKVLAGFVTVMERGESGPRCLQYLRWGLEHLSRRLPKRSVVKVSDGPAAVGAEVTGFCERFARALEG